MKNKLSVKVALTFLILFIMFTAGFARAGGGGGDGDGGGGGSSSYDDGGSFDDGGGDNGGGAPLNPTAVVFIIVIVVITVIKNASNRSSTPKLAGETNSDFPNGLNYTKVSSAFIEIQQAWMFKDLKNVRRWISDGVYQRFTTQFSMMNRLDQVNRLSNIRINSIAAFPLRADGNYQTVDVAISFTIDDDFESTAYPEFNERFEDDNSMEYWTFIKRTDAVNGKDLYEDKNCPNCGAPFKYKMGEISRCSGCGTLTNSAAFDWVLCEITQKSDYIDGENYIENYSLLTRAESDPLFAIQRIEDIASNVFMQVMAVVSGGDSKPLNRFAAQGAIEKILKHRMGKDFVFNRLYVNSMLLTSVHETEDSLELGLVARATFKRVQIAEPLHFIDTEPVAQMFTFTFSRNKKGIKAPEKEIVYSYECTSCGAPFADTTDKVCTYCGEAVLNKNNNWILQDMQFPYEWQGHAEHSNSL